MIFATGSAPVTPEHHFAVSAEFDDRATCEAVLDRFRKFPGYRVNGACVPKGSAGLGPETRREYEQKFPPQN